MQENGADRQVIVRHREYRDYEKWRVAANDCGEAVVIALRITRADLHRFPDNEKTLPLHYGEIEDIQRLNVTPAKARAILADAEEYYAATAIPFFFSVLNDYLVEAAKLLVRDGAKAGRKPPQEMKVPRLWEWLKTGPKVVWPPDDDPLLEVIRCIRNDIIHNGGRARNKLIGAWSNCPPSARQRWKKASGRSFSPVAGDQLTLASQEARAVLAVTQAIAKATNNELARLISTSTWATLAVEDWQEQSPSRPREKSRALRKLLGFCRMHYKAVGLKEGDLAPHI